MNCNLYQLVFDKLVGRLVAVGEHVSTQRKSGHGERRVQARHDTRPSGLKASWQRLALAAALSLGAVAAGAQTLPTGPQVVVGQIAVTAAKNSMTINQASQRGVIDWATFDVGAGSSVRFAQPDASSQTLNRVVGGAGASQIAGSITANGQVLVQNPNGMIFQKGSVIDASGLLATTKVVSVEDFMAGKTLNLTRGSDRPATINAQGLINARSGGYVILAGDQVRNSGSIDARRGQVILAAGDEAVVSLNNGQPVKLTITRATASALVDNSGIISADGGNVVLTSRGANTLLQNVINLTGVVQAAANGVTLDNGDTGKTASTGRIDVRDTAMSLATTPAATSTDSASHSSNSSNTKNAGIVVGLTAVGALGYHVFDDTIVAKSPFDTPMLEGSMTVERRASDTTDGAAMEPYDVEVLWDAETQGVTLKTKSAIHNAFGQTLKLVDSSNGILRYRYENVKELRRAELTLNMQTKELYYRELSDAKQFRARGWVRGSTLQASAGSAATS